MKKITCGKIVGTDCMAVDHIHFWQNIVSVQLKLDSRLGVSVCG